MAARLPRRRFAAPFVVTLAALPGAVGCRVQAQGTTTTTTASNTQPTRDHRHDEATPTVRDHRHDETTPPPATTQPGPNDPVVIANPPRPSTSTAPPATTTPTRPITGAPTTAGVEKPTSPTTTVANPPRPSTSTATPAPTRPTTGAPTTAGVEKPRAQPPKGMAPKPPVQKAPTTDLRWSVSRAKATCTAFLESACPAPPKGQPAPPCNPPPPTKYTCPDFLADGASIKVVQRAGETECWVEYGQQSCPKGMMCNPPPPRQLACPK